MKKKLLIALFIVGFTTAKAQSYLGYFYDNYSGVQSTLYNPAFIVDSRFKTDINLFSFSALGANDYYGVKLGDVFKSDFDFEKQAIKSPSNNNNFAVNTDIMGPSFMFNIAPKHAVALFSRARLFANISNINGEVFNTIQDGFDLQRNVNQSAGSFNVTAHAWSEIGLSYAAVLWNKDQHFLKGGFSLKYLQGIANRYYQSDNLTLNYTYNNALPIASTIATTGSLRYGGDSKDIEDTFKDFKLDSQSTGLGIDLGLVYEWRPNFEKYRTTDKNGKLISFKDVNKYKLRLAVSVTDIGSITYNATKESQYNLNRVIPITKAQYDAEDNLEDLLNRYYTKTTLPKGEKANLPTTLHANVDWNLHNKFYLNLNGDLGLTSKKDLNTNTIANVVSLTPRYESKWFSFYVPINWMEYRGTQVGAGLRLGTLFVGSGSVLTNLVSKESKGLDLHLGLKIPIYQGKLKDRDSDGVLDKFDDCPEIPGPVENHGCPWKDSDKDGVFDKDDKCPDTAGPVQNNGCPYLDSDKDGVLDKDDACPNVVGPEENKGCPWKDSDNDGVLDKDDKCPTVAGTIQNNGCPEVKAEPKTEPKTEPKVVDAKVIKQLNDFSKSIQFDNGKATIKTVSFTQLDEIASIMNEYEGTRFAIEGHTDNTGKAASNLNLSKNRAAAVKNYLTNKGVNESRLTSEGFGSKKPIASNKTKAGKAKNRRVEIKLIK